MKIQTKALGEIEIEEYQIIEFKEGILGFPDFRKYALVDSFMDPDSGNTSPFKWLQSMDDKDLAFVVIEPAVFCANYQPICSDDELAKISIGKINQALILLIVTIPDDPSRMTANLQGPILINKRSHLGVQAISLDENHKVRHSIIEMMENERSSAGKKGGSGC